MVGRTTVQTSHPALSKGSKPSPRQRCRIHTRKHKSLALNLAEHSTKLDSEQATAQHTTQPSALCAREIPGCRQLPTPTPATHKVLERVDSCQKLVSPLHTCDVRKFLPSWLETTAHVVMPAATGNLSHGARKPHFLWSIPIQGWQQLPKPRFKNPSAVKDKSVPKTCGRP